MARYDINEERDALFGLDVDALYSGNVHCGV